MFARSNRADKTNKRGRFNLGEKLVLACCRSAEIDTTSGTLRFRENGTVSKRIWNCREKGTLFSAEIRMTRDEYAEVCEFMCLLLPPVATTFNGKEIERPNSMVRFTTKLPTEIADTDGRLRRTVRLTEVEVYEAFGPGAILELGIPVVETENSFRVNVLQKVPLSMERDNVTPAFLRAVQAALLNHVHEQLTPDEAAKPWVQEATGDARVTKEALLTVKKRRFGERAVSATPNDPLANARAEAEGFTVIPGGAMDAATWANIRKHEILLPSSKAFPTPTPEDMAKRNDLAETCPTCGRTL